MDITYKITFFSDWHAGSGLTSGVDIDALPVKDGQNLPYVPGKTIKGLLRAAAFELLAASDENITSAWIYQVFGPDTDSDPEETISTTVSDKLYNFKLKNLGEAFFTNATIAEKVAADIVVEGLTPFLYRSLSSTRLDSITGTATDTSLRKMEVVIPMELSGEILWLPENSLSSMRACMAMVKQLGQNRHRGLGRCTFSIIDQSKGGI